MLLKEVLRIENLVTAGAPICPGDILALAEDWGKKRLALIEIYGLAEINQPGLNWAQRIAEEALLTPCSVCGGTGKLLAVGPPQPYSPSCLKSE
mgnify:CR=1 FL=1